MTVIDGQTSIFDLLTEGEANQTAPRSAQASYEIPAPCPACGEESPSQFMADLNHWGMPGDREDFGHEVCVSMSLKLNHLHHGLARAGDKWPEKTSCCWTESDLHGRHVKKPTREQWLDHARKDLERCLVLWKLHLPSLRKAVAEFRVLYGITPQEFPNEGDQ